MTARRRGTRGSSPKNNGSSSLRRNNTADAVTISVNPKDNQPGFRRNGTSESIDPNTLAQMQRRNPQLPGLMRKGTTESAVSIDPSSLGPSRHRRMRNVPTIRGGGGGGLAPSLHDSSVTTSSVYTSSSFNSSISSFASRWNESIKFSVKNFLGQKEGRTLEEAYEIGDLLGQGGFGEVYAARLIETEELRAVKVMQKAHDNEGANEAIVMEYNILKELDHPNILKVYEMYETEDHFFIVTDLYGGGDMFTELDEQGCLDEYDAAELMNAMLNTMNYCHKRNLVHLDLKPENVLLTNTGEYSDCKIIDFGLAQYQEAQKKMTGLEGSSYYMSPQVVQRNYIGSKADVWSCGVICHVMLTGYAPFDGPNYEDILEAIVVGEFDFDDPEWDEISEECKSFIRYCLTYDEDERPSAEDALRHPFLKKCRRSAKANLHGIATARKALQTMEEFSSQHSKLKQATCVIMASQLLSQDEKNKVDLAFRLLDTSCDGELDRGDLKRGYRQYLDKEISDEEVDKILDQVNFSASGALEFSEFAIAVLLGQNKVTDDKLKAAFNVFDEDGKGYISADDVKRALKLGDNQDKYLRKKILRQVAAEETGKIDFDEFKKIVSSTASLAAKRKKPRRISVKRSPRRALVASGLVPLEDIKDLHCAPLADGMDASELSNHSNWYSQERRPGGYLENLSENENEDNTSGAIYFDDESDEKSLPC